MVLLLNLSVILGIFGCQTFQINEKNRPELSLSLAEEIQVGKTSRQDVLLRLGKPDRIIDLRQSDYKENVEIWAYFTDGIVSEGRIAFSFSTNSELVDSISFDVRGSDPEIKLENALARYKENRFVKSRPKFWSNPHYAPEEEYYRDASTGLTIIYSRTPKEVTAISWETPGRKILSEHDPLKKKPYPFCIADICTPLPGS